MFNVLFWCFCKFCLSEIKLLKWVHAAASYWMIKISTGEPEPSELTVSEVFIVRITFVMVKSTSLLY